MVLIDPYLFVSDDDVYIYNPCREGKYFFQGNVQIGGILKNDFFAGSPTIS